MDWLALDSTQEHIATLAEISKCEKSSLLKTKRGRHHGGTWMHPKLAVPFARWLDTRFAIWCDFQIDGLIRGNHPHYDRQRARDAAACSHKVMAEILRLTRLDAGKTTMQHHYQKESKLVNWVLAGEFKGLNRDALSGGELALLASLEERNAVFLGSGIEYDTRKQKLEQFARDWREGQQHKIGRAA